MKEGKLFEILSTFDRKEVREFLTFTESAYFNKNTSSTRLLQLIITYHPDYPEDKLENEKLFSKLFKGKKFNNQVLKNLLSHLTKLSIDFLRIQESKAHPAYSRIMNLRNLNIRHLDRAFEDEVSAIREELQGKADPHDNLFYYLFRMETEILLSLLSQGRQSESMSVIVRSGDFLLVSFFRHFINILLNLKINKDAFNIPIPDNLAGKFFESIDFEKFFSSDDNRDDEIITRLKIYFMMVKANFEPEEQSNFIRLKEMLFRNIKYFGSDELNTLFKSLEVYCAQKINLGHKNFYQELYDVFQKELDSGFYLLHGNQAVTSLKFRNTYLTALRAGKTDWALDFIEKYKSKLSAPQKNSIINMAYAHCHFEKGEFENALEFLSKLKTRESFLKIDIRNIMIMCHYELGNFETALSLTASYKQFVRNNPELPSEYSEKSMRFASSVASLISHKSNGELDEMEIMANELKKYSFDRKIEWIISKIRSELSGK